jgi:immunoglobulin-like protein involved in spore germination/sporulation and spore germination protein
MMRSQRHRPALRFLPILAAVPIMAALLGACSAGSAGDLGTLPAASPGGGATLTPPSSEATPGATGGPGPTSAPGATPEPAITTVRAYFILGSFVDNAGLVPVLRDVPATEAVGSAAMTALLAGPIDAELGARPAMYTAIPEWTRFLGLEVNGGIATVNLSREFEEGGGSASVLARLAQVVYTLTQFPTVKGVTFELDGEPVEVLGGEGAVLRDPATREDYTSQLPVIFVDRPAWGGVLGNPARITGVANVFEATFQVRIADGAGRGIVETFVTADCGTGCWGAFDATIPYSVPAEGWGTLQVYELSARDGSVENLTEYPVWLTPGG